MMHFSVWWVSEIYLDQRQILPRVGIVIIDNIVNALVSISQKDDLGLYTLAQLLFSS